MPSTVVPTLRKKFNIKRRIRNKNKMKILIVNAYADTYRGKKKFDDFVAIIKEVTHPLSLNSTRSSKSKSSHY